METQKDKSSVGIFVIVLLIVIGGIFYFYKSPKHAVTPTPVPDATLGWKSMADNGVTFKYPETLGTTYIKTQEWPPKVTVAEGPFTCTESGSQITENGQTVKKTINGHVYCVTIQSEGAAGSTYTTYTYVTMLQNKMVSFNFVLKAVQCGNYNDPEKSDCESERANFDIDSTVDKIVQSATL
jgi:hypothetical protein